MFVVGKSVTGSDEAPEMTFSIVGTTGNIYKTTISKVSTCDCPDAQKGNQCKHICYGKYHDPRIHLTHISYVPSYYE